MILAKVFFYSLVLFSSKLKALAYLDYPLIKFLNSFHTSLKFQTYAFCVV